MSICESWQDLSVRQMDSYSALSRLTRLSWSGNVTDTGTHWSGRPRTPIAPCCSSWSVCHSPLQSVCSRFALTPVHLSWVSWPCRLPDRGAWWEQEHTNHLVCVCGPSTITAAQSCNSRKEFSSALHSEKITLLGQLYAGISRHVWTICIDLWSMCGFSNRKKLLLTKCQIQL